MVRYRFASFFEPKAATLAVALAVALPTVLGCSGEAESPTSGPETTGAEDAAPGTPPEQFQPKEAIVK